MPEQSPQSGPWPADLPPLWEDGALTIDAWESIRRPELLRLFADHVYGRTPAGGYVDGLTVVDRADTSVGPGIRIEADVRLAGPLGSRTLSLLVYAPHADRPVPTFLGLNFAGNHAITPDQEVRICPAAVPIDAAHRRTPTARGAESRRWPVTMILQRGYAVATAWYEELEIDLPGHAASGVRGLFAQGDGTDTEWGAIGGWAWSLSRILEALAGIAEIDHETVFAVGHSRLGKTALWAAAQDVRFAGVISNDSGCGGASLFRHRGIEDIRVITDARPHWFAPAFSRYRGADERLPVDQHQLIALQAPRLTHVGSASRDAGADPEGEFLSTCYATPAFQLYGRRGPRITSADSADRAYHDHPPLPQAGILVGEQLSYHLRNGDHDMLADDWAIVLDAADAAAAR